MMTLTGDQPRVGFRVSAWCMTSQLVTPRRGLAAPHPANTEPQPRQMQWSPSDSWVRRMFNIELVFVLVPVTGSWRHEGDGEKTARHPRGLSSVLGSSPIESSFRVLCFPVSLARTL